MAVTDLRCEYLVNPLGIDMQHPRLSWKLDVVGSQPARRRRPHSGPRVCVYHHSAGTHARQTGDTCSSTPPSDSSCHASIKKLVDYLGTLAAENIISEGLGDHMEPQFGGISSAWPRHAPVSLTSTAYYYYDALIVSWCAGIIGKEKEAGSYADLAGEIRASFNNQLFDERTNQYGSGSQTSNALALYLGLAPKDRVDAVLKNLVTDIMVHHNGHLSTGIIGTNALQQALPDLGRAEVMYTVATQTTFPSWGYSIAKGATTVWETFEGGTICLNMKMFCNIEVFLFKYLAGVKALEPGFKKIGIKPCLVEDLAFVNARVNTVHGNIGVAWSKAKDSYELSVEIPANCRANVSLPACEPGNSRIMEANTEIWRNGVATGSVDGITYLQASESHITFEIGSGKYVFSVAQSG